MGIVALHPVPTIIPIATRLFGNDFTKYAREAKVATVSLVIAAIFNLGSANSLRRFADGSPKLYGRLVCLSYPARRVLPRFRFEVMAKPLPVGISVASERESCLSCS